MIDHWQMDHLVTRIFSLRQCTRGPQAAWVFMLAVTLLQSTLCTVAAQQTRIVSPRLAPATKDSLAANRDSLATMTDRLVPARRETVATKGDTLAVKRDTTQLLIVTAGPDSSLQLADTVRAKEAHPQDSPVDRGFMIRTADGKSELRIVGSVRLNGVYDFNGLQTASNFNTYDIPVGDANIHEARFQMTAAQTRLALEATKKATFGDIFVKVETDFLGPSDALRLRHAYVTVSRFLFGQTWSTFGDLTALPLTVDLDGPNSSVSTRTVQIRYMGTINSKLTWDAAIESPSVEATIPDSVGHEPSFQSFPDVIFRMRQSGTWGHAQLAGVLRSISVRAPSGSLEVMAAYGFLVSGRIYLGGSHPHRILYQFVGGKGVSRYITALKGEGLDLVYNPLSGSVELTASAGGYISYAREWVPSLLTYVTAGFVRIRNIDFFPDNAFSVSEYISANLFWDIAPGMRLGVEYAWGRRVNKNGDYGNANRVSFLLQYDF